MPRKSTGRRLYGCGILHTKRFKKEIDLALLGIEKWADDRAYFCTPRKAGIIGRNGVSGALCRHELYRYAGTAGRRYDPCGLRRRGSPQTGALRPGSAEDYFVCSRERVYRRCGWPDKYFYSAVVCALSDL